ncbi:capsular polysaccharide transport system permease protein [Salinihabitans flavidus]|uniref:Capsular polysaccharide transport system permease protein n=1 Tax=Salinihabitans flavidus TaxID=569882 RepID=A0A1H8MRU5_9RHOB|nr:capsule biosynthesis protein [Salinihabitans flavidus]SEO19970.1 capsular polysaccharide transport system permease protein [Salinihabitans flavidus]
MTTKPKAKKFRIRRSAPHTTSGASTDSVVRQTRDQQESTTAPPRQEQEQTRQTGHGTAQGAATDLPPDQDIDAIKREGLSGRQLRMARRVAQKNGLAATSDYDAIRLLRSRGIDPFHRTNMLELVVPDKGAKDDDTRMRLPQTVPPSENLPSTEQFSPMEQRGREISDIQRDIARRRRRKMALLFARLSAFIFLPTLLAGWYFYVIATPMYATNSAFLILQADSAGGSQGLGSMFSGTQFATNQDSIATQDYLQSKDAMVRLDEDEGFKSHFADPEIDPLQRLPPNPSNEKAHKLYKKYVKIGYDPTEGVIRMEVSAADPKVSQRFSEALISYAEARVDDLSQRKREDQLRDARESLEKAQNDRRAAQATLVKLQEGAVLDPEGLIASLRSQVTNLEVALQEKELELQALLDNERPNQARLEGVRGDVRRMRNQLQTLESRMTQARQGEDSLAQQAVQIQMAQADLATADLMMQTALQTLKQTELEAGRQVRYLETSVKPVVSQDPTYPRAFENTILAFLIFSGIYLMISLTASILREQVSS